MTALKIAQTKDFIEYFSKKKILFESIWIKTLQNSLFDIYFFYQTII